MNPLPNDTPRPFVHAAGCRCCWPRSSCGHWP